MIAIVVIWFDSFAAFHSYSGRLSIHPSITVSSEKKCIPFERSARTNESLVIMQVSLGISLIHTHMHVDK